jgi:hypothetical protein
MTKRNRGRERETGRQGGRERERQGGMEDGGENVKNKKKKTLGGAQRQSPKPLRGSGRTALILFVLPWSPPLEDPLKPPKILLVG